MTIITDMDIVDKNIQEYCDRISSPETEVLKELNRETYAKVLSPRMLSGHFQGRLLSMLSHMIRPNRILEIGTYTGYSAICMAEGLAENGKLITIDVNPELETRIRNYISKAGMENKIQFIVGDAYQIIRTLPDNFDMVFIDADKQNYKKYYDLVIDRVNPGGFIISDNVLWSGKVVDEVSLAKDKDTINLNAFNEYVSADTRVEKILLPVRDGLLIARKK